MIRFAALFTLSCLAAGPALSGSLVATRSIIAKSLVGPEDFRLVKADYPGAADSAEEVVGKEARVTIWAGKPLRPGDLGPPALVDRNDIVRIRYAMGSLEIATDGRALDRGAAGERVRAMNLNSRTIISGVVTGAGDVTVTP